MLSNLLTVVVPSPSSFYPHSYFWPLSMDISNRDWPLQGQSTPQSMPSNCKPHLHIPCGPTLTPMCGLHGWKVESPEDVDVGPKSIRWYSRKIHFRMPCQWISRPPFQPSTTFGTLAHCPQIRIGTWNSSLVNFYTQMIPAHIIS